MTATKRIRLFVDAHVFDGEHQGSRTFIKELYSQLAQNGNLQLFMAAYNTGHLKAQFPDATNITYVKYSSKNKLFRLLFQIPYLLKKHQIDYAHFQYMVPLIKPCRFIVTTHDVLFNDVPQYFSRWYRIQKNFLYRYAAVRADILTTVSAFSQQAISRYFKISTQNIHVIPHGVNAALFQPYDKTAAQQYAHAAYGTGRIILYVSRFEPRKNHALLLQTFTALQLYNKGYSLVLAGHRSLPVPAFDTLLHSLPEAVRKSVFIFPGLDDTALVKLYQAATVFVYPSAAEGFGMPPLEAAALALPVLCNNSTALADFTFFKANHFDMNNDSLFRERLLAALNAGSSNMNTAAAKQYVQQHYSWENAAAAFYKLIEQNNSHD